MFKKMNTMVKMGDKDLTVNSRQYKLHETISKATLGAGNLIDAVKLPAGEDKNEWLAFHCVHFYTSVIDVLAPVRSNFGTTSQASAGPKFKFLFKDNKEYIKPEPLCEKDYIELSLDYIESSLNNESIFPSQEDVPFPKKFGGEVKVILKRLFRIMALLYHNHFNELETAGNTSMLNTVFKHWLMFVTEFKLMEKADMAPLQDLIESMVE